MNRLTARSLAEFLGTFALVFAGCGAIVTNDFSGGALGHVGISITFGLIVAAMIYAVGNISGAHLNPAVTIGFCVARRFPLRDGAAYIAAQMIAAVAACGLLRWLFPEHDLLGATLPALDVGRSLVVEIVLTFLLFFVILNVSTGHMEKGIMAGAAIGGTVALAALAGGPLTGASMNPARSLGPALVSGQLYGLWIYFVGPLAGALAAAPLCRLIQGSECCPKPQDAAAAPPAVE